MRRWNRWILSLVLLAAIALAVTLGRLAESAMSLGPLPEHGRAVRASEACPPEENSDFVIVSGSASVWSWYQQRMAYMAEPILACGPSTNDEAYRFTWVHAFTTLDPLSVRVVRRGDTSSPGRAPLQMAQWTKSGRRIDGRPDAIGTRMGRPPGGGFAWLLESSRT
jgi:hypothetical protein